MARAATAEFSRPVLIERTEALAALCERLRADRFVTVDTEFIRERTYWPELCVVQLAGSHDVAVVDAQVPDLDLAPLAELLADTAVTKVFHAARQDIEIFLLRFGAVPTPLFDTQIAAMVAGFGDQVAYDALVAALAGGHIDKAHRFSDWSARPLSAAQVAYAAADVTFLRVVYERLLTRLEREGRLDWVAEDMAELADPETYRSDPETAWERLRPRSTNRRFLATVRVLAAWREREAQRVNIPRQRLLKDEALLEIAASAPVTPEALARARGLTRGFAEGKSGASLLAAIEEARGLAEDELPPVPIGATRRHAPPLPWSPCSRCSWPRNARSITSPRKLVASADDIDRLALGDDCRAGAARLAARGVRRGCSGPARRAACPWGGGAADQARPAGHARAEAVTSCGVSRGSLRCRD